MDLYKERKREEHEDHHFHNPDGTFAQTVLTKSCFVKAGIAKEFCPKHRQHLADWCPGKLLEIGVSIHSTLRKEGKK